MFLPSSKCLEPIQGLCSAVWANSHSVLHKQVEVTYNTETITVNYLDLTPHIEAVEALWPYTESKILICQEYVAALAYFTAESSKDEPRHMGGWVILGQPGIGARHAVSFS